jgi:hypothetical protein
MPSADGTRVGQRVQVDHTKHAVPPELVNQTLEVASLESKCGRFVTLKGPKGTVLHFGRPWIFNLDECLPATAKVKSGDRPRIVEREERHMQMANLEDEVFNTANELEKKYNLSKAQAAKKASEMVLNTPEKHAAYRGVSSTREPVPMNLSNLQKLSADEIREGLQELARARGCSVQEAAEIVICRAGAATFEERVEQLRAGGLDANTARLRATEEDPDGAQYYELRPRL